MRSSKKSLAIVHSMNFDLTKQQSDALSKIVARAFVREVRRTAFKKMKLKAGTSRKRDKLQPTVHEDLMKVLEIFNLPASIIHREV